MSAAPVAGCALAALSPIAELSQSLSDMPARRAVASARSRTDGSISSTLHGTRDVMPKSGVTKSGVATRRNASTVGFVASP